MTLNKYMPPVNRKRNIYIYNNSHENKIRKIINLEDFLNMNKYFQDEVWKSFSNETNF